MNKKLFFLICFCLVVNSLFAQGIDKPRYQIVTHRAGSYLGTFKLELFPLIAPNHTRNFDSLALALAFDSTAFHRVLPGFVIQGGDPNSIHGPISTWGQGNVNQPTVNAEFSAVQHLRGIIGAARDNNINSASSQFYICVAPAPNLNGQYTVFGKVTEGMNIVDTIVNSPKDLNDVPLQKIEMFVTYIGVNNTIPTAPSLISPANNSVNVGNTQNITWSSSNDAILYTAEFSVDSLFSMVNYTRIVGVNATGLPNVLGNTKYFWRVKANNGGHESAYSNVRAFTTKAAPQLVLPINLDTGIVLNPLCKWTKVPGATTYLLQIATNTSFTSGSLAYYQAGITDTINQATGLLPNTTYFWRVRGNQGTSQGLSSQIFSFKTGVNLGIRNPNAGTETVSLKSVFPNPIQEEFTASIESKLAGSAYIKIHDASGKVVLSEKRNALSGPNDFKINSSKLSKGVYFLSIEVNKILLTEKIEIE
ncbi:MAG: peptidylprolyl isomerase [Bacteroidetes bacterium]|nr:peptidylprolyl isomerase [Bacteroidota bacterium]